MGENFQSVFFIDHLVEIAEETVKNLGGEKAHIFVNLYNDWIEVYSALFDSYSLDEPLTSLVAADLLSLQKEILWLHRLFHWGNYPMVNRSLRFDWELIFRAYHADTYAANHPGEGELPGPSVDDKAIWLRERENRLNWRTVIEPVLQQVLSPADRGKIPTVFGPLWDDLNSCVHPSWQLRDKMMEESALLVKDNFDETLANETIRFASQVFDLIWLTVLARFPKCAPLLNKPNTFLNCPRSRSSVAD